MTLNTFKKYVPLLKDLKASDYDNCSRLNDRLIMDEACVKGRTLKVAYAPFDYINTAAKIVIAGITPGHQQMRNAISSVQDFLRDGEPQELAAKSAKEYASFSGPMRSNLVSMLDHIGVQKHLGITSCAELWTTRKDLVHFTSVLRYPVFLNGKNYAGQPSILRTPLLKNFVEQYFEKEAALLKHAIFIPLGPKVAEVLHDLVERRVLDNRTILDGLPHPSGANAERIAYFLGKKPREKLSPKTEPKNIDSRKAALLGKINSLPQLKQKQSSPV